MTQQSSFEHIHADLLGRLQQGERPHLQFNEKLLNEITDKWTNALENSLHSDIDAIMCVLEHARHPSPLFDDLFFLTLEKDLPKNQLIFTLGASWKHMLGRWSRAGDRLPMRYLEILRKFLNHPELELREWSLRTIDQVGPQGQLLKADIQAAKVGWRGLFNPHAKAVAQLAEMLEKRWSRPNV
ncbi:MAG: hypothetical protein CME71_05955 [Halobacteriovorax sp.]|nr:hypothetical protein [Halobacteriovorax sp.]